MIELSVELREKLKNLFYKKEFSSIERTIESIGNLADIPIDIKKLYAVSKSLNPKSTRKDFKLASFYFEQIFKNNKSDISMFYNLILTSVKAVYFEYLEPHLEEQYTKNKQDPKILEGLAKMSTCYGNMEEASFYYKKLLEIKPNYGGAWKGFLASLNYHYNYSQTQYLEFCKKFDEILILNSLEIKKKKFSTKIKVGFLSPNFKSHSVSFFLKDLISHLDQNQFKLYAFSNLELKYHDKVTSILKKNFNSWHDIHHMPNEDLIKLIRSLDLDILIDLAGYFAGNRVEIFKARCAPIQISWLGYCNSLGIKNIDYLIADHNLIKQDEHNSYSEKILYMPNIWNVISKFENFENVNVNSKNTKNDFVFGSFNNFQKISNNTVKLWSRILNNSNSRLILKNSSSENLKKINYFILKKFEKEKVDINKILILDPTTSTEQHLECYNLIDLSLDTFPYPGVTTTFESILMGVPVLTLKGFNFVSRCGESINKTFNLDKFIAVDEKDYFNKAINFYLDTKNLYEIKKNMRENIQNLIELNSKKFVKDFSFLLKNLMK